MSVTEQLAVELGVAEPLGQDETCAVCFHINPLFTTVVRDGTVTVTTEIPCGRCGRTTSENLLERERRGIPQ